MERNDKEKTAATANHYCRFELDIFFLRALNGKSFRLLMSILHCNLQCQLIVGVFALHSFLHHI